jgi:hypothetical protein
MRELAKVVQEEQRRSSLAFLWQRNIWWLSPVVIPVLLLAIIYVLARLSAADSEMYPTTQLMHFAPSLLC